MNEPFSILMPERVPVATTMRGTIDAQVLADLNGYCCAANAAALPHAARASALMQLHERLPVGNAIPGAASVSPAPMKRGGEPRASHADEAAHDTYFGIVRVDGSTSALFLRAVLLASATVSAELATCYSDDGARRFGDLDAGLARLLSLVVAACGDETREMSRSASQATGHVSPSDQKDSDRVGRVATVNAALRWRIGHQIFATLSQGIVFALKMFSAGLEDLDEAQARAGLDVAADLLLASAASFRFTADFPPAFYRDTIRPSMADEHVGAGFSGLLSADHRHLVRVMTRLRPVMNETQLRFGAEHAALSSALQRVYDDHKFVCARFDGAETSSLRGSCNEVSGVEQLDRFKHARMRLLRSDRRKSKRAMADDRRVALESL